MKLIEYPDREALVLQLAQDIAGRLRQALRSDGRATLCLPGGTTPAPLFSQLSELQLEWDRVIVFPGDERCVPPADARSNARLVRHQLMQGPAAAAQYATVRPGITGLWQVSGRSDLSWEESVRLDLYYVENWSVTGDLLILARTVKAVFAGAGAY